MEKLYHVTSSAGPPLRRIFAIPFLVMVLIFQGNLSAASSSSPGKGYAQQYCGTDKFYCPYRSPPSCLPRTQRCLIPPTNASCIDPSAKSEPECRYSAGSGFELLRFRANLSRRKKRDFPRFQHEGILYRGFAYEFGQSYPAGQELDILGPYYIYRNGADGYRVIRSEGYSRCSRDQAYNEMRRWTSTHDYSLNPLTWCTCQTFADDFVDYLTVSACGSRRRRSAKPACSCAKTTVYATSGPGNITDESASAAPGLSASSDSSLMLFTAIASAVVIQGLW